MEEYWFWLCSQKELYRPHIDKLIQYFRTPAEIYHSSEKEIRACRFLKQAQIESLIKSRSGWDLIKRYHEISAQGISFISADHSTYPIRLKQLPDYPFGLFLKGKLPDHNKLSVGIVGARRCSFYGKQIAERLAMVLAENGVQIISGMALGIDGYAQTAALSAGGESFALLGCGVDVCYPLRNRNLYQQLEAKGGILSEYPLGREPLALHFPIRNRLISRLADYLLVIEAKERSGSLITAEYALEQGKDILAVPGRIGDVLSAGCNSLISQGAGIILSENDLLDTLNFNRKSIKNYKKNQIALETKENLVYSCLDFDSRSLQEIAHVAGLPVQEVMSILTILVMKGYVEELAKNYYARIN